MWLFLDLSPLYFSLCSNEIPWKQLVEVVSSLCVYCFLNHAVTSQHLTEWWVKFVLKWKKWWLINLSRSALVNNWTACVSDTWSIQSPRQAELSAHYHQTSVIIQRIKICLFFLEARFLIVHLNSWTPAKAWELDRNSSHICSIA